MPFALNGQRYRLLSDTARWSLEVSGGETCIRGNPIQQCELVGDRL